MTDRQNGRQAIKQRHRQSDRQTERLTNKQIDRRHRVYIKRETRQNDKTD